MQHYLKSPWRWIVHGLQGWQASFCLPRWLALPAGLALLGAMAVTPAMAQPSAQALSQRCWADSIVWRTRPDLREPISVRIGNLRNGDTVPSPFWLDFGVRGMGIIPAGTAHAAAGHHHVLIDTPLPMSHVEQIPFSNKYRHFGKGQTGTLLELPPGRHTLRLLFADHEHRPYFVYSPEISFTVEGARTGPAPVINSSNYAQTCSRWLTYEMTQPRTTEPHVYLRNVRANDVLPALSVIALGVVGFGVAPSDANLPGTADADCRTELVPGAGLASVQRSPHGPQAPGPTHEQKDVGGHHLTERKIQWRGQSQCHSPPARPAVSP